MAYDSATATDLALKAWQQTQTVVASKRANLLTNAGLNGDGSLDGNNKLGSIYQGNEQAVQQDHAAEMADRARGFGGSGGLAGKATAAADRAAQLQQAGSFQQATQGLGANTQENDLAGQDYQNQLTQIRSNSAQDTADTLRTNLLYGLNPDGSPKAAAPDVAATGAPTDTAPAAPHYPAPPLSAMDPGADVTAKANAVRRATLPPSLIAARAAAQRNQTKLTNIGFNARR